MNYKIKNFIKVTFLKKIKMKIKIIYDPKILYQGYTHLYIITLLKQTIISSVLPIFKKY